MKPEVEALFVRGISELTAKFESLEFQSARRIEELETEFAQIEFGEERGQAVRGVNPNWEVEKGGMIAENLRLIGENEDLKDEIRKEKRLRRDAEFNLEGFKKNWGYSRSAKDISPEKYVKNCSTLLMLAKSSFRSDGPPAKYQKNRSREQSESRVNWLFLTRFHIA